MTLEEYAYLAEIIGVIIVVVTLIYLTVQVRQNTEALHSQSRQSLLAGANTALLAQIEHPEIVTVIVKEGQLSPEENVRLNAWLVLSMRRIEFAWQQFRAGVIDEHQWNAELRILEVVLRPQRSRDWWERLGRPVFTGEFSEFVDKRLAEEPPTDELWHQFINWTNRGGSEEQTQSRSI